jgi:hypothetical protein
VTEERAESGGEYSRGDKTLESKWEQLTARGKENGSLVRERERDKEDRRKRQERKERGGENKTA